MNLEDDQPPSDSETTAGASSTGSVQDTNGNPANRGFEPTPSNSSGASRSAITGNNLGARPKVRRNVINSIDQVVPNENHEENGAEENDDNNSDEDFYVYRYTGSMLSNGSNFDDEDPLEAADLPKSFYRLDVGSDSEGSSLPRSLGGVSGAGQSNLSTEVAALIQSEMASQSRRRQQQQQNLPAQPNNQNGQGNGAESPDMDFLEMDFDPGDESDTDDAKSYIDVKSNEDSNSTPEVPVIDLRRPQELRLDLIEEPSAQASNDHEHLVEQNIGNISAPLQSPAIDLCDVSTAMTRSRSLNSPLVSGATGTCQHMDQAASTRNKRRHSGEDGLCTASSSSSASMMSAEVNMELCGARLSQREALVFGVPGSANNVHRAMLKLRMLDRNMPNLPNSLSENNPSSSTAAMGIGEIIDDCVGGDEDFISNAENSSNCNGASSNTNGADNDDPTTNLRQKKIIEKTMIWTELEACKRQVNQIGVSACGATALINVLQALDYPYVLEKVTKTVPTKLRAESAPIPEYLFSRSVAGTSHQDLVDSMTTLTNGEVYGRFFSFFPERQVSLLHWLAHWLSKGVVPVATLNLQNGLLAPGQTIPDAWHHQMIFGVSSDGVFLTNPLESVSEHVLMEQLSSQSQLLVRRADIISRWHPTCDLQILAEVESDERWDNFNVLGQVIDVLREDHQRPPPSGGQVQQVSPSQQIAPSPPTPNRDSTNPVQRTHVRIPAVYRSGVTLFVNKTVHPDICQELMSCPELSTKHQ